MHQLSGLDASFLYGETPTTPMHVGGLQIYDPSTAPTGEVTFERILGYVQSHLHLVRTFREKLLEVPMNLDHPYWVDDGDFDLEFHVRELALPRPGTWEQLCIQTARLMSRPLDLSRPLWEIYVVRGIDDVKGVPEGSFGLVSKVHHAAIDGVSGMEMTATLNKLDPSDEPDPPAEPWVGEREPQPIELINRAALNGITQPMHMARVVGRTVPAVGKVAQGIRQRRMTPPPLPGRVPRTRFNGQVDAHRVFDAVRFPFATFKTIRQAVPGCTVNDAVLTIVGGALRRFLDDHGELPDAPLIAMAPISIRTPGQSGTQGNQVAMMLVSLGTDVAKPVDRLAAVYESTSNSKEVTQAIGASTLADYSQFIPSTVAGLAARLYTRTGLANRHNPIFTTTVTNVPGPAGAALLLRRGDGRLLRARPARVGHGPHPPGALLQRAPQHRLHVVPDDAPRSRGLRRLPPAELRRARARRPKGRRVTPSPKPPAAPSLTPSDLTRIRCRGGRELASDGVR